VQSFTPNDNCNGGDIHRPLLPKSVGGAVAVPSCRYINVSGSTSDNRSNVDDVDTAAVHIQLRTDDAAAAAAATGEPCHGTDAPANSPTALPTAPVCGGYIVVGPDTFGRYDPTTGRFVSTDSGIVADHSLPRLHGNDHNAASALASTQNQQHSDLSVPEDTHRLPADRDGVGNVNSMQGNSNTNDSTPVANYTVIMGMDNNEPDDAKHCSLDTNAVAEHTDTALTTGDELSPGRSISDREEQDDLAVPFGVSSPPACYSLNSGGYLSHSELLGAAPAL